MEKPKVRLELQEDSNQQNSRLSELDCSLGICDGSGFIYSNAGTYINSKVCKCVRERTKLQFLGERFYRNTIEGTVPRNARQTRLKEILMKNPETSIFLYGKGGVGKTHFLAAMYNYMDSKNKRIKYLEDS